jgi:hypothetical protein
MNLKSLLQDFLAVVNTPTIHRRQILEYFSGKVDLSEFTETIRVTCEAAILTNGPTTYDTAKFIECVNAMDDAMLPSSTLEITAALPTFHAADSRSDTNAVKVIKTKSYRELEELIDPRYPLNIYISGETGLGKSTAVLALAEKFNKPVIRVNLSGATDLDDLLGGIRIIDGNTVFDPGPVAIAMELGAILLLDEVDAAKPQILIDLHPVLEKKGVLAKKARKMIYPTKGFCVIATGNSKGVGDPTGKYIGVNNMNHAFLQRFGASIEFTPVSRSEIAEIVQAALPELQYSILANLCNWYEHVLKSYDAGTVSEYINTRKMIDIGTICLILGAKKGTDTSTLKAIRSGLNLYETALAESLVQLYDTIVEDIVEAVPNAKVTLTIPADVDEAGERIPF